MSVPLHCALVATSSYLHVCVLYSTAVQNVTCACMRGGGVACGCGQQIESRRLLVLAAVGHA
jgi:hypothetical protein